MAGEHALAIQVGDKDVQVHEKLSVDDTIDAVNEIDERLAGSLKATEQRLAAVQKEIVTDPDMVVEYFLLHRAQSRIDEQLSSDLESIEPDEHFKRVDQYHRYSTVGSALLYRDINFSGGSKFFSVTWPNFKWWPYKFNDAASSAKAWGGNILFEHTWYGGRRLYLVGIPFVQFPDLHVFEFNDLASSFASIP
jgi:hypothetical protein